MMSEKQERQITFTITEEYIARYLAACNAVGIHGVGSFINLTLAKDCEVTVYPGSLRCSVYWEAKNQKHREVLHYTAMPVLYELSDGILLRLNEYTVLFLPITEDAHSNQSLRWMRDQVRPSCHEVLSVSAMQGNGIGLISMLSDELEVRKPHVNSLVLVVLLPAICCLFFIGVSTYLSWKEAPIPYEEVIHKTAVFLEYKKVGGAKNIAYYVCTKGNPDYRVDVPRDRDGLRSLPVGTEVELGLHPRSGIIMEMIAGDTVLVDFDEACESKVRLLIALGVLDLVCFATAVWFCRPIFEAAAERRGAPKRAKYDMNLEYERQHNRSTPGRKRRKRK